DHFRWRHHPEIHHRMPGSLRWRPHDAGGSPIRGEPDARSNQRNIRPSPNSAGLSRATAGREEAGQTDADCLGRNHAKRSERGAGANQEGVKVMGLKPVLTKDFGTEGLRQLDAYERTGGYAGYKKALSEIKPDDLVELVKKSGLRGRGGAGFPTGNKWSFLPKGMYPRYLVCNADESEPGCFKDRYLIEESPHQVLEGILIASYAIGCNLAFIYIRGEYLPQTEALERAIEEARQAGVPGQERAGEGLRHRRHPAPRRRSLHLRRGDGNADLARGLPRRAPPQATLSRGQGAVRKADGGQQRRDRLQPAAHRAQRRGVVQGDGHPDRGWDPAVVHERAR